MPREHPGVTVERLEHKLGIKASDTAVIRFDNARIPKDNLLGNPEIQRGEGFCRGHGDLRQHPADRRGHGGRDRPRRAGGAAQDPHRRRRGDLLRQARRTRRAPPAAEFLRMEADWEAGYLLTLRAAWQADNNIPNSKEASMAKAKAGRVASDITLKAVELAGTTGYSEQTLLEKWARDSQDPRHLRGHPADPAAGGRPPAAGPVVVRAEVDRSDRNQLERQAFVSPDDVVERPRGW